MKEQHRIRQGLNEWNHPPEGYYLLSYWDAIQGGDVQKINDEWFREYPKTGMLIDLKEYVGNGTWYRKKS